MPIYTYRCTACGKEFDYKQSIKDEPLTKCPEGICEHTGQEVQRVFSKNIGLVFKGSGFYLTDYAKKNSSNAVSSKSESKSA